MEIASAILAICVLYGILYALTGRGCPIKFLTGVSCPGCGMTRACVCLAKGDIRSAWDFHPLFPLPFIFAAVYLIRQYRIKKQKKSKAGELVYRIYIFTNIALFFIVYMFRMISGNSVAVTFDPGSGAVYRLIRFIINKIGG